MTGLPEPLTPSDCDLRDFPRMMIDITRLRQSAFDAIIDDGAWRAGINLWFSAWHSVPAGSLPDDDAGLAKAAGLGRDVRTWGEIKADALRGFTLCSDGRLYHDTVCEFVLEAWMEKLFQRISSGAGNAKRWGSEFDPAPIDQAIHRTAELLAKLNPASKALAKAKRKRPNGTPAAPPPKPQNNPTGRREASHRDNEAIPPGSQETGTGTLEEKTNAFSGDAAVVVPFSEPDEVDAAFAEYSTLRAELKPNGRQIDLAPQRRRALAARLKEIGGLPGWHEVLATIRASSFLRGDTSRGGKFVAEIDWLLAPANLRKLREGNYDDDGRDGASGNGAARVRGSTTDALREARAILGAG